RDRVRNAFGPFREEATTLKAEDTAPYSIQMRWNNRHLPSLHNPFEAATERQQCAGTGNLSFREDADKLSVVDRLPRATQCTKNHASITGRRNRDDLHGGHQPFEQRVRRIGCVHYEPNGPIDTCHEQEAIDERHVVRDEKGPSGLGNILLADDAEAIEGV